MEQIISFRRLLSPADAMWSQAWDLYIGAFPENERRSAARHAEAVADPLFRAEAVVLGDEFAGLIFYWLWRENGIYIEHLAVEESKRGHNIGSRVLAAFSRRYDSIVLEIEPPEDLMTRRREAFYMRAGFQPSPYPYLHPSYSDRTSPHLLVIMGYPSAASENEVQALSQFVRTRALLYSDRTL